MSFMKKFQAAAAAAVAGEKVADVSENTEARKKSLEKYMDSTITRARDEIQVGGYWKTGPDVEQIEAEVHKIYMDVLRGLRKLDDHQKVVMLWKNAGTIH